MLEVPATLKGRSFTRINDWSHDELRLLLDLADTLKTHPRDDPVLPGRTLGLLFDRPSTHARVSFSVAIAQLGGVAVPTEPERRGEPLEDVAAVLSRYLDAVVFRARRQADVDELAAAATIPVINDETDTTAPCQALADLMTIRERLGRLSGVRLAYVGEGNNVCRSLMRGAAKFGMRFIAATPPAHRPAEEAIGETRKAAIQQGGTVEFTDDPLQAADRAEVLYTSAPVSDDGGEAELQGYALTEDVLASAQAEAFVMHSPPAGHGVEIGTGLLHGPRSAAWDQAENRLHAQKALLALVVR